MEGWLSGRKRQVANLLSRVSGIASSNLAPSAKIENRNLKPKWGRHEVPTQMYSPQKILILQGFATLRVAQKVRFELQ